ncbi:MAG TPA: hypothetical protein VHC73_09245 [Vitreimonas sp.]|mgnify:CR=1 FL=1|jgi:hypothetical protein|nr:hypothetical protein [Vitreimonas sp.]
MLKGSLRTALLSLAMITALPSCSSIPILGAQIENPVTAARTLDQQAYAVLDTYAVLVEEATKIVADPNVPITIKRGLGAVEKVATPAAQVVESALAAYMRARADFEAASGQSQTTLARAADALSIAGQRLSQAIAAASPAIAELQTLVHGAH